MSTTKVDYIEDPGEPYTSTAYIYDANFPDLFGYHAAEHKHSGEKMALRATSKGWVRVPLATLLDAAYEAGRYGQDNHAGVLR